MAPTIRRLPWGPGASKKASKNQADFLSIGLQQLPLCNVMEKKVFSNPEIAAT